MVRSTAIGAPYSMAPHLLKLRAHALDEGHLHPTDTEIYSNEDPVMHWYVKQKIEGSRGKFYVLRRYESGEIQSTFDTLTGRKLNAIGVPYGDKTINQPIVDLGELNEEEWKYHVQSTLTEEGHCVLYVKDRRVKMKIGFNRFINITDKLPDTIINLLKPEETGIQEIKDLKVRKIIDENPPQLLIRERNELAKRHADEVPVEEWPDPRLENIYKSKNNRVSANWAFRTSSQELIDILHDRYGMLPGTWKSLAFEKRYELYKELRGKDLTDEEVEEIE